jgi:hypothetical protein
MGDVIPVVSDRFAEALLQSGVDNFQTFPALVRNPHTGKQWTTFKAFNVLGLVDAVHEADSVGEIVMPGDEGGPPPLVEYETLVFDARKTRSLLMFRLAQTPSDFFLADRVVQHLGGKAPNGGWGIVTREIPVH